MMTVKEVADLTGVTVKTLHHYHKIGLLQPADRTDAGYRLYGKEDLKLLQEILFYKELDIPLKEIKQLIEEKKSRKEVLKEQRYFMREKQKHLESLSKRIDEAIIAEESGHEMDEELMFRGITLSQWMAHLEDHSDKIEEKWNVDVSEIDLEDPTLLSALKDVEEFMNTIEDFMKKNTSINDPALFHAIETFITYWNEHYEEPLSIDSILEKGRSYLTDKFQRQLMKTDRLDLRAYLHVACLEYRTNMEKVEGENE